jgi:heme-degrading monooxygenase HmoA
VLGGSGAGRDFSVSAGSPFGRMGGMAVIAEPPEPPYYAVIFTSIRNEQPDDEYETTAARMEELARRQPGFLGIDSAREGVGITVSYWTDEAAIAAWKADAEHVLAQRHGRDGWYRHYAVRVARVERAYAVEAGNA